jgi:two-component system cell cycle response regulator DivK
MTPADVRTVLLVDDDEDCHAMYGDYLRHLGFVVLSARDGLEGMEATRSRLPSVVVMDVSLPKLDGLEATKRLKADSRTAAIPVIVLTAHVEKSMLASAEESGCDAFVTKPCIPADLVLAIEGVMDGQSRVERRRSART